MIVKPTVEHGIVFMLDSIFLDKYARCGIFSLTGETYEQRKEKI